MADQPSIFEGTTNQETPDTTNNGTATTTPPSNDYADLLSSIKNERGETKYKTVQDALNGLKHAQEYIPQVKQQASEAELKMHKLEAEVQRLSALEETVLKLTERQEQSNTNGVTLGEEDIAKLVERTLTKKQVQDTHASNTATVVNAITQKFGADAEKVFYTQAQEMGMTMEEMNLMAARTPKAVLKLLGISEAVAHKQTSLSPTQGTVSTSNFQQQPQSFIGREPKSITIGQTTQDLKEGVENASKMMEELAAQGYSSLDLANPKVFRKLFNKK